ncbi:hypothetical protein OSTOST_17386, partial [Ostertagia ostertagi]
MVLGLLLQLLLMTSIGTSPVPMRKTFPTAIIVGVKKAGTRALLEFLRLESEYSSTWTRSAFFRQELPQRTGLV